MAYSEKVIDHYQNPKNVGTLDKASKNVGTGLVGAPECGDVMRLQIEVDETTGMIKDAKFKTFGCGSAIASSSLATEWLKGKNIDEALKSKKPDVMRLVGTEGNYGEQLGLTKDWAVRIIRHVGNYGEMYERNVG
ncbi:MAG TPA: iron-sulfur cluster assembly scaffold protein, partial [Ferruginibacter sp.]|nr:iron-sulfur cluster assembly scaffold protein [Ferruginibacter sp.]